MQILAIPQHRDPVARAALIGCALALVWLAISSAMPPAVAQEQPTPIILVATPTLPPPVARPMLAAATPPPRPTATPEPPLAAPVVVAAPPAVAPAAPQSVGEKPSTKPGPGQRVKLPVVRR